MHEVRDMGATKPRTNANQEVYVDKDIYMYMAPGIRIWVDADSDKKSTMVFFF